MKGLSTIAGNVTIMQLQSVVLPDTKELLMKENN